MPDATVPPDPFAWDGAGPLEGKVRQDIAALVVRHPMGEALAELAYALARGLDARPESGAATLAKELRATLSELAGSVKEDDDDFTEGLSAPSWNTPES